MINTKRLLAIFVAGALSVSAAFAAPIPSGPYVGVNVGYDIGKTDSSSLAVAGAPSWFAMTSFGDIAGAGPFNLDKNGVNGGAQLGYLSTSGSFAWGLEADFTYMGRSKTKSATAVYTCCPEEFTNTQHMSRDWLATLRARLGIDASGTLIYATGGLAVGDADYAVSWSDLDDGWTEVTTSDSDTLVGWTVGGGIETMLSAKASAKVEYLYVDLGSVHAPPAVITGPAFADTIEGTADFKQHVIRLGINLHF